MKHLTFLILCTTLMFVGCAIEEVDENRETGTLYFRAENVDVAAMAISGQLEITGFGTHIFSDTMDYLAVTGLPVDSTLSLSFTPSDPDSWNLIGAEHRQFRLETSVRSDTIRVFLAERTDSTLSVLVRTFADGVELSGLPLWLDGARWPEDSPATLYFSAGTTHQLESRNESCSRGARTFAFADEPTEELILEVTDTAMGASAHTGAADADLVVNGELQGSDWEQMLQYNEEVFISAWRAGHRPDPPFAVLNGFCGGNVDFDWIPSTEGYQTGQLFPDFSLPQVEPGQSGTVGDFLLRQVRGRVTLVTFWYATCVNCLLEMPGFQTKLEEYGSRGFRVLALDPYPTDYPENYPQQVLDYDFIFLRDVASPPVAQRAGVGAFPTNFLLLPDGTIHSVRGAMSEEVLDNLLQELLPE